MPDNTGEALLVALRAEFGSALKAVSEGVATDDGVAGALDALRCELFDKTEMSPDDVAAAVDVVAIALVGLIDSKDPCRSIPAEHWKKVEEAFIQCLYRLVCGVAPKGVPGDDTLHGVVPSPNDPPRDADRLLEHVLGETLVRLEEVDHLVWFVTNRRWRDARFVDDYYPNEERHFGTVTVATIRLRSIGDESVGSHTKRVLRRLEDDFWGGLLAAAQDEHHVLVYVHGFNVPFETAMVGAAHLALDVNVGPILVYAWPTTGNWPADTESLRSHAERLAEWLRVLLQRCGNGIAVDFVAHSLGAELLTEALALVAEKGDSPAFGHLVLSAAYLRHQRFRELLPRMRHLVADVTVYASRSDLVLRATRKATRNTDRVGLFPPAFRDRNVHTILVPTSGRFPYHSYHAESPAVLHDLQGLLVAHLPPEKRQLRRVDWWWELRS
jgi:hypothetical protein